jgi:hypothetical protein
VSGTVVLLKSALQLLVGAVQSSGQFHNSEGKRDLDRYFQKLQMKKN